MLGREGCKSYLTVCFDVFVSLFVYVSPNETLWDFLPFLIIIMMIMYIITRDFKCVSIIFDRFFGGCTKLFFPFKVEG